MPQFDKITFFNQIFWLIFIFLGFYIILLRAYLPKISSILKTRNKKLTKGAQFFGEIYSESSNIFKDSNQLLSVVLSSKTNLLEQQKESPLSNIVGFSKTVEQTSSCVNAYYNYYAQIAAKRVLSLF